MKILHTVEFYTPSVNGMQEVVKQISERLVQAGHEVTVATQFDARRNFGQVNGVKIEQFEITDNQVRGYGGKKSEIERYQKFLLNSDFDIITNFAAQQWATDLMLPLLDQIKAKKVFVPTGFSALYDQAYHDYFEQMKHWLQQYDMNVFLSDAYRDIDFARANNINNRILIPNGASEEEFSQKSVENIRQELGLNDDCFLILTVGNHTTLKGHKEAIEIFKKADLTNACLLMIAKFDYGCGHYCQDQEKVLNSSQNFLTNQKKLVVKAWDREKTIAAFQTADLFLFPSNIECSPIVLFEAMASKVPFLVTEVGNAKEIIDWTGGGLLLPSVQGLSEIKYEKLSILKRLKRWFSRFRGQKNAGFSLTAAKIKESVKLLEKLYQDKSLRQKLGETGYQAWRQRFTWAKIAQNYEKLYFDLINK